MDYITYRDGRLAADPLLRELYEAEKAQRDAELEPCPICGTGMQHMAEEGLDFEYCKGCNRTWLTEDVAEGRVMPGGHIKGKEEG